MKEFQLLGDEFARRFAMHILPRSFGRMRYAGLFMVSDRTERLAECCELIGQWKAAQPKTALPCLSALSTSATDEDPATEATHQVPKCLCRYCQGELEVIGHLKGTETETLKRVSQDVLLAVVVRVARRDEFFGESRAICGDDLGIYLRSIRAGMSSCGLKGQLYASLGHSAAPL